MRACSLADKYSAFVAVIAFLSAVAANEIMKCANVKNKFIVTLGTAFAAAVPFFGSEKVLLPFIESEYWGNVINAVPNAAFVILLVLAFLLAMLKGYSHTKFEDVAISVFCKCSCSLWLFGFCKAS